MVKNNPIYKWALVALLWGVALLNYMDRQMLAAMRPSMMQDIQDLKSATVFGYLMGIFLWIYGFMSPLSGMLADRISRKWLIIVSLFVWSGVTFAMGLAVNFHQLYWLRATMGISEALYIPAGLSLIADFHDNKTRSLAIGIHMTGIYFGQALGGFGATVSAAFSWQTTFHVFGLTGMMYSVILIIFLKEARKPESMLKSKPVIAGGRSLRSGLALLFSNISFWIILFYFAVPSLPGWATKNWLPTLFSEGLHIPMTRAAPLATIAIASSSFVGVLFGGLLSDRWILKNIRGRIYTSAIGLSLTIPSLLLMGFGHSVFPAVAAALCFGIGWGMYDANNMPILCQFVSRQHRATAYGIMNMTGVFAGAYITELLGKSSDAGNLGTGFALLAAVVLAALILQLLFLRPRAYEV